MQRCLFAGLLVLGIVALTGQPGIGQDPKDGPPPVLGGVIPPFVRSKLTLSADQQKRIDALESTMRAKLGKALTEEQLKTFDEVLMQGPPRDGNDKKGPPQGKGGMPPMMPSLLIPPFVESSLKLTTTQQKKIAELDASARMELSKILTLAQQRQFLELLRRGPESKNGKEGGPGGKGQP